MVSKACALLFVLLQAGASPARCDDTVDRSNFTVALVRTPPPNWPLPITNYNYSGITFNISECVDAGVALIQSAAESGSNLIVFPELWFPGFPKGLDAPSYNFTQTHLPSYIDNTIVVGDLHWTRILNATREAGIYAQINFAERDGDYMYMSQSLIDPDGEVLIHRRKLRPSGSERYIFSDGTTDGLQVVETAYGRWGVLECGEHLYPSMTFNMHVQMESVHMAPFPYLADAGDDTSLWWENEWINTGTVGVYSVLGGTYSLTPAVGVAFITDPLGYRVAHMSANASFEESPLLIHSFDTSTFNDTATYDVDGQMSWGVLEQIRNSFPAYVPKVEGALVPHQNHSIAYMQTGDFVIAKS